jgi:hypothetical protein
MYPEIVKLAAVLSSPEWRQRLLADSRAERAHALLDVFEVVLDGYMPYRALSGCRSALRVETPATAVRDVSALRADETAVNAMVDGWRAQSLTRT